jgi:hypothetical protein
MQYQQACRAAGTLSWITWMLFEDFADVILVWFRDSVVIKDLVTHFFKVLFHKYDAQIKISQYCKFQKALFKKILPNLTFHVNKGR